RRRGTDRGCGGSRDWRGARGGRPRRRRLAPRRSGEPGTPPAEHRPRRRRSASRAPPPAHAARRAGPRLDRVAMATRTTSRGQRCGMAKRILVAEDDPDNRCIVVKVLTLEGYETLAADDGRSALALARRERPDLIVMDLGMPGMDGWEAARRLKADPQTADIPIIALTAWDEERAREAGCDGYLSKPCRPKTIREAVVRFLADR